MILLIRRLAAPVRAHAHQTVQLSVDPYRFANVVMKPHVND